MSEELKCCKCRNVIKKRRDAWLLRRMGITLAFDRLICLSLYVDEQRRMAAQVKGQEWHS